MQPRIGLLVEILDHAFTGRAWHGTTVTGALRGVTPKQALWRPNRNRHCIWELVLHIAYWKYAVRRRLAGGKVAERFPRAPSNWPAVPERPSPAAWRADLRLLRDQHAALRAAVAALSERLLAARSPTGAWRYAEQIHGVAAHDLYHTGQIQLIKRLM